MRRRDFLQSAAIGLCAVDGKWIWNKPPENETGYLESRRFRLRVSIELIGRGDAEGITATTPVPIAAPEQEIVSQRVVGTAAEGVIEAVAPLARQLRMFVPQLGRGQTASAVAEFELLLRKQYFGFGPHTFPAEQTVPPDLRTQYLGNSPGIETRSAGVQALLKQFNTQQSFVDRNPWLQAQAFAAWIRKQIAPKVGPYTSVEKALENRVGDCEEMAGVFVALCRAAGIPARLVWIPNHVWSEFHLVDAEGKGHWIPVHTACYHWFGWTGAHELVIQKGDRIRVPGKGTLVRLQQDRMQWGGVKPEAKFQAELTPLAAEDAQVADSVAAIEAAGPGARRKEATGEWVPTGKHPQDKYLRR